MNRSDIAELFVNLDTKIRDAIKVVDRSGRISIALLVDEERRLLNTLTDGDIRRGILAGFTLESPVRDLLPIKAKTPHPAALTAPAGTDQPTLLKLMQGRGVRQIPLLDAGGKVVDIVILHDLLPQSRQPMQAVIMAGGKGTRLLPLTEHVPKPMLLVGGRPLMERIMEQLQQAGIRRVNVTTHYKPEKIIDHFGKGDGFGVDINYVNEANAMGTAGALSLMPPPKETLLVINGDVLTDVGFEALLAYHQEHHAEMTVGVRQYALQVPYGVIECEGTSVRALREKPEVKFLVNAGIYLIEPSVYEFIPGGEKFDMTDLIQRLLDHGRSVISYPIVEYWLDVGQHADFKQAQQDTTDGKCKAPSRDGEEHDQPQTPGNR